MLTIPEEVLLLQVSAVPIARRKDRLRVFPSEPLAGGRLIELVLAERITVERQRRHLAWSETIVVVQAAPIGDALLDATLERVGAGDPRSCAYWVKHLGKGSQEACWDRLVAKSLLRPDILGRKPDMYVVDAGCVASISDRIRAVLEQRPSVDLRDAALVTLLAHTGDLFDLLHESHWSPAAVIRDDRDKWDRLGRQAIDDYQRLAPSPATANAIRSIARATVPEGGGAGGI